MEPALDVVAPVAAVVAVAAVAATPAAAKVATFAKVAAVAADPSVPALGSPMRSAVVRAWRARAVRRALVGAALAAALAPAATAQEEVPFVTTPDAVTQAMLEVAAVGARDHVVDLGSGDGRIVIAAARRGASALGVEIVPELVAKSRADARAAGVERRVEFREQDLFKTDLARATVVTMYLLPDVNLQLRPRLLALAPGTRIVSHDWEMGDWRPERTLVVDAPEKAIGREKVSRVHLWTVPARVAGLWCAAGARLEIAQRFDRFSAALDVAEPAGAPPRVVDGTIAGRALRGLATGGLSVEWRLDERDRLVVAAEPASGLRETAFVRAAGGACG